MAGCRTNERMRIHVYAYENGRPTDIGTAAEQWREGGRGTSCQLVGAVEFADDWNIIEILVGPEDSLGKREQLSAALSSNSRNATLCHAGGLRLTRVDLTGT